VCGGVLNHRVGCKAKLFDKANAMFEKAVSVIAPALVLRKSVLVTPLDETVGGYLPFNPNRLLFGLDQAHICCDFCLFMIC
jgi:hypothetical protein